MSNHPSVSSGVIRSIGLCVSSAALGFIACKLLKRIGSKQNDDPKDLWDTELKQMIAERKAEEAKLMETLKLDPNQTNLSHAEFALASLISVSKENVIDEKVCGCDSILDQLNLQVVLPFQLASTKMAVPSSLYVAPKGILLFGPDGCGKRMIARAIAKEANAHFLAFNNAFCFGDPMYMKSLFTLSEKIQPCVIFIDDIDLVFPRHLKSFKFQIQFFSQWEEFMSSSNSNLVVIGATSRMQSIDGSVLSRFPLKMHVPLPDQAAREKILRMLLWNEDLEDDFKFAKVALETEKLSGSELKEVVHLVLLSRYQQVVKSMVNASLSSQSLQSLTDSTERGQSIKLSHKDIIQAFHQFKTTSAEPFSDETIMTEEVIPVD